MNRFFTYLSVVAWLMLAGSVLWACETWDLPGKKSKRDCVKPSGTLDAAIQQRQVSFSISSTTGTIDQVSWDFGNGSTTVTTGTTIRQVYTASGTYTVRATLTNSCGDETTLVRSLDVSSAVLPTVTLQDPTEVSINSATLPVTVTSNGNTTVTQYGLCYSATNPIPELSKDQTTSGPLPATVNATVPVSATGLGSSVFYYVRAFAVNSVGVGYSTPVRTFRTGAAPIVSTNTNLNAAGITTANVSFILQSPGNPAAIEYGICYSSTNSAPDVTNSATVQVANPAIGNNTIVNLTGLAANTKYYYRAYARLASGQGVVYSDINSFNTQVDTVATDLVALVSFTDQSILDLSGSGNHAILVKTPTFTTDRKGRANSAIQLDGAGDYVYMAENSSLRPTALSISIWIKPTDVTRWMQIYNKSRFSDGAFEMYSSLIRPSTNISGNITINTDIKQGSNCQAGVGWQTLPIDARISVNTWHHVVLTYSGRSAKMYFDGALLSSIDNLPASAIDQCPGGELKFGAQNQALPNYFYGALDDIRIYKRAITASEVQTLYNL